MEWKKTKKGQAVMEYLITYGLALFVILIVLAILIAVVLPSLKAPETCSFTQPGFSCNQRPHAIIAGTGNDVRIVFQLDNTQGRSVEVGGVLCTSAATGNIQKGNIPPLPAGSNISLASGQSVTLGSPGAEIECFGEDGTTVLKLAPNSNFKGSIGVLYKFSDDLTGAPTRLAVASVSGTVQAE